MYGRRGHHPRGGMALGGPQSSGDLDALLLGECQEPDLVDRAQVAGGELECNVAAQLRHPQAAALDVDVLPTSRLDVRVRDVLGAEAAFAGQFTSGHGARECSSAPGQVQRKKASRRSILDKSTVLSR